MQSGKQAMENVAFGCDLHQVKVFRTLPRTSTVLIGLASVRLGSFILSSRPSMCEGGASDVPPVGKR